MGVLCIITLRLFRLYTYGSNYTHTWGVLLWYTRGSMQARTPPDVWYRGEIKKKNKKGKSQPKSAQSMLCYGLHILKYINAKIIL